MAEEYAEECSRVACLQLAAMSGFETVNNSSLTVLSDMLQSHIKDLCKLASSYSEGAGRTKVNAEDLVGKLKHHSCSVWYIASMQLMTKYGVGISSFCLEIMRGG